MGSCKQCPKRTGRLGNLVGVYGVLQAGMTTPAELKIKRRPHALVIPYCTLMIGSHKGDE